MVPTFNILISFILSFCLLPIGQSKIVDQVYERCNRPASARLQLECIGFPKTSSDCLSRRNCDMIAMLTVIPSVNGNHFYDKFNITLVGTHLRDASKHEMSLILDAAFKPTYHPGEGTYYNCSWSQREQTVEVMVKNPGQLVESIGIGIIDDDLLICTWVLDRRSDAWPTDHEGRKIDLVTRKIEVILYKDYSRSGLLDTRLPIYKSRYLYHDCDSPDVKYCLGSPYCVDTYYECHELLTIVQIPPSSLDFNLFSFDYVTNNSYYDVTLYTSDTSPAFQVICGKYSIEAFFIFPNGSQESVSILTSAKTHIDPEFDGLRCNWSLPATFIIHGVTFDTQRTKYLVKLRHSPNVYVDKVPVALPGFHIDDSLYTACSSGALGRECFGLDVDDPTRDCLPTRDCKAFAVFTVDDDASWSSPFVEPKVTLDLYATRKFVSTASSLSRTGTGPSQGINMSLALSTDNELEGKTVYKCLYNNDGRKSASIEVPFRNRAIKSGLVLNEHDWIRCQWIWWPNGTNWPTNNKSDVIDLVNRRPSIQFSVGGVRKIVPQKSVSLPIYKFRYLYHECDNSHGGEENLCLESELGCLKTASCTSLVHMREHSGREAIDVQILLAQEFDKFELIYTDPEDNSIKIDCYSERTPPVGETSMVTSYYRMAKTDSYQQINADNQLIKYNESRSFAMGFSRCFWLQEKQFQLGRMFINSEANRYNVRLQVTNDEGLVARYSWDGVAFVGYRAKDKQSVPSSSLSSHPSNCWSTTLVLSLICYHLLFVSHN